MRNHNMRNYINHTLWVYCEAISFPLLISVANSATELNSVLPVQCLAQ